MKASDLNQLFLQAPVAICILSGQEYIIELVNERMLQFLGRTTDVVGSPLEQTLTEAKEQGLIAILDKVRFTRKPQFINRFPALILIDGVKVDLYFDLVFKPYYLSENETEPSGIFCVAHNVTEAVKAQQRLEEEQQRTALALETGGLGMIATDWEAGTVTADKRTDEIFGIEGPQPMDVYISRIHPEDVPLREKAIKDGMANGNFTFEARLLLPDNTIRWIQLRGMVKKNSQGLTGTFGLVQDITTQKEFSQTLHNQVEQRTAELKIANSTLQQLNEDLLRSNANLEEFARAASHDLKEPVRKMQVFTSRLKETLATRLTEEERDVFSRMEKAAERMALLVDDLLDYAHLGGNTDHAEAVDLNEKLDRILSDLELLVTEKGAKVEIGPLPVVRGKRRQLQQLFQNLLTNALKYSRPGVAPHIKISASLVKAKDIDQHLPSLNGHSFHRVQITDNGIGFQPADAEKIFNVFTRLHGKDEYAGTGIGLSIAKKVVENHQGHIFATGQPGQGATFTVLLPAEGE